jgi:hypothetical protein
MELYALYFVCFVCFVFCMLCIWYSVFIYGLYFVNGMIYLSFVGHWMYLDIGRFDAQIYNPVINKL